MRMGGIAYPISYSICINATIALRATMVAAAMLSFSFICI